MPFWEKPFKSLWAFESCKPGERVFEYHLDYLDYHTKVFGLSYKGLSYAVQSACCFKLVMFISRKLVKLRQFAAYRHLQILHHNTLAQPKLLHNPPHKKKSLCKSKVVPTQVQKQACTTWVPKAALAHALQLTTHAKCQGCRCESVHYSKYARATRSKVQQRVTYCAPKPRYKNIWTGKTVHMTTHRRMSYIQ